MMDIDKQFLIKNKNKNDEFVNFNKDCVVVVLDTTFLEDSNGIKPNEENDLLTCNFEETGDDYATLLDLNLETRIADSSCRKVYVRPATDEEIEMFYNQVFA